VKTTVVPGGEVERLQKQLQDTQLFGVSLMNQLRASQEEVERLRAYNQSIKSSITEALGLCDATCDWGLAVSVIQAQKLRVERLRAENAELRRQVEGIEQSRDDMLDAAELYMDKLDAAQAELAELRQQLKRLAEILGPLLPIQEPYGPYARILLNRAEAREVVELLK
jgi:chromosome segregation ATPase